MGTDQTINYKDDTLATHKGGGRDDDHDSRLKLQITTAMIRRCAGAASAYNLKGLGIGYYWNCERL